MSAVDVRWKQRLQNYKQALDQFNLAIKLGRERTLTDLEKQGLIQNGDQWMEMIKNKNQTTHTYNKATADEIVKQIQSSYAALFDSFFLKMIEISKK